MAQKRSHPNDNDNIPNPNQTTFRGQPIYRSSPIHDRSSTFLALYSPSPLVLSTPKILQQHPDIQDASHRILAWRKRGKQLSLGFASTGRENLPGRSFETGSDDDGEKYAGRKVEAVLERMGVEGVIVVARWYGGVMLGPVRFKWIEDCAKEAIGLGEMGRGLDAKRVKVGDGGVATATATSSGSGESGPHSAEGTTVDEGEEKNRLTRILEKRDESINILRSLLATRNTKLEGLQRMKSGEGQDLFADNASKEEMDPKSTAEQDKQSSSNQNVDSEKSMEQMHKNSGGDTDTKTTNPPKTLHPDYKIMPLQRLKQLEKARDATISWILKQIDAAEEKIRMEEEINSGKAESKVVCDIELTKEEEEELLRDFEEDEDGGLKS